MSYTFTLKQTDGKVLKWPIENGAYRTAKNGDIISFDVKFTDGSIGHYAAAEPGKGHVVQGFFKSYLDQAAGGALGASVGRVAGAPGMLVGAFAGYVASRVLEQFVLEDCSYHDAKTGKKVFEGPININDQYNA